MSLLKSFKEGWNLANTSAESVFGFFGFMTHITLCVILPILVIVGLIICFFIFVI